MRSEKGFSLTPPLPCAAQFVASFVRSSKQLPEIGPQAFGVSPLLQRFSLRPRNNWPTAICATQTVNADIPNDQARLAASSMPCNAIPSGTLGFGVTAEKSCSHAGWPFPTAFDTWLGEQTQCQILRCRASQ